METKIKIFERLIDQIDLHKTHAIVCSVNVAAMIATLPRFFEAHQFTCLYESIIAVGNYGNEGRIGAKDYLTIYVDTELDRDDMRIFDQDCQAVYNLMMDGFMPEDFIPEP